LCHFFLRKDSCLKFVFSYASSRERDAALADQKATLSQLDAERSDYAAQIDHLKEQLHEKERQRHEADEQVSNFGLPQHLYFLVIIKHKNSYHSGSSFRFLVLKSYAIR
jgi:cell division protein FtsB